MSHRMRELRIKKHYIQVWCVHSGNTHFMNIWYIYRYSYSIYIANSIAAEVAIWT